MADAAALKRQAAEAAFSDLEEGINLGIGTGSTAEAFIRVLGEHVRVAPRGHEACGRLGRVADPELVEEFGDADYW